MANELKPCPFCGAEGEIIRHMFHTLVDSFGVGCSECKAQTWQFFLTRDEAIEAWNRREGEEYGQ